ncbi:uncharacterized protein LOC103948578 isoform X2 [Pyrus x bretschneideri]|uniref:uncharacterized protein LOC103948578 isoform X2 n=1 Tax=Pyrus x bretschneideri TaxID=225117 RepID=UPI00202E8F4C|nr:uncharacterized protein LOC103948578 isoform X2 [Pyrus x bretschneideri]
MVEKDGSAKGIVFSQFTSFLDISRTLMSASIILTKLQDLVVVCWFIALWEDPEGDFIFQYRLLLSDRERQQLLRLKH